MRRAERLFRLVNEMRSRGVCTGDALAQQFEVSLSTIYRDIAHLQASGLPIDGAAGVGYILRPGFDLPNVTFTHDQIDALAVGLSYVEGLDDPVLSSAAQEVRAKIQATLPNPEHRTLADAPFYSVANEAPCSSDIAHLRKAVRNHQIVDISYTNGQGSMSKRSLRPILMWHMSNTWMVSGWCELRQDFRTFRMDRMASLVVTERRFDLEQDKGVAAFFQREP
ncbi:MAG: YafY family protein [Pseudomonadota bacterium]